MFMNLVESQYLAAQRKLQEETRQLVLKRLVPTFTDEIRCLMYTSGDFAGTVDESALLVEKILRDQMNRLLIKATELSPKNNAVLTHEPLLLLLIKNRDRLKRLLFYLHAKDTNELLLKKKYTALGEVMDFPEKGKRVKTCLKFLRTTDGTFDSIMDKSVPDPVSLERSRRRYYFASRMEDDDYKNFSKKQETSFYLREGRDFKKWILADKVTESNPTDLALEMLNHLARETVFQIVDLCLSFMKSSDSSLSYRISNAPIYPETIKDALRGILLTSEQRGNTVEFKYFKTEIGLLCVDTF